MSLQRLNDKQQANSFTGKEHSSTVENDEQAFTLQAEGLSGAQCCVKRQVDGVDGVE